VLGNEAKRNVRPARDDRKVWLLFPRADQRLLALVDRPVRDGSVFKNANPALRTGLLSNVPAGRVLCGYHDPFSSRGWAEAWPKFPRPFFLRHHDYGGQHSLRTLSVLLNRAFAATIGEAALVHPSAEKENR
jgi:hypothetical protein